MGKHLKQKSAPVKAEKKSAARKQPVKSAPPRKTFLDMIAPGVMKFNPDVYIRDNLYCCVWALKEYPAATEDQAILRHLGEKCGVNIRIYTRIVDAMEENRIIQNATNKNRLSRANTNDTKQMITAEGNLQDVFEMVNAMRKRREPLIHCAVFIELCAPTMQELERLQSEVISELLRSKLNVDRLRLRQQKGYLSTCPQGHNIFGTQFERVLPASSVANLYIYNYSGKTDAHGFYIGKDRYGSNILTDFDQRDEDKTSANVLILGNSGQGKSYLMKLLMVNCREAGKNIISLDVEHEQGELCAALDGCFIDLMGGQYIINVLEPKCWSTGEDEDDPSTPETFKKKTVLSQHLSFLRDFFRAYKDFTDPQIDTIEILLSKLYSKFHISDYTNFAQLKPENYPVLSDLYDLIEDVHLIIFSTEPNEGYLTKPAILELRSALTRQIFKDDLKNIYVQQTAYRDKLQENALAVMESLIQKMQSGEISNPKIELLIAELVERLQNYSGKKVYGYLPPATKHIVDAIVDELAGDERVAEAYSLWQDMRDEVFSFYSKAKPERVLLSKQKEFKPVRNMVIRELVQMMEQQQYESVEYSDGRQQAVPELETVSESTVPITTPNTPPRQEYRAPPQESVSACMICMLHHMGNIFRDNARTSGYRGLQLDKKRRKELQEWKIALGHREDDHEDPANYPKPAY